MHTFKIVKHSAMKKAVKYGAHAGDVADFVLVDNETGTLTAMGTDAATNPVDISAVATMQNPSVSDPTLLSLGVPAGVAVSFAPVGTPPKLGTGVTISASVVWNDGSIGPFSGTSQAMDVVAGPAGGIVLTPSVP